MNIISISFNPLFILNFIFFLCRYILTGIVQGGIGKCGDQNFPAIFIRIDDREILDFIFESIGRQGKALQKVSLQRSESVDEPLPTDFEDPPHTERSQDIEFMLRMCITFLHR